VSRNHLAILFKEAGLGESGALSEENIPKLGKIKGIDLILTATLNPAADYVRVNAQGVEIESSSIVAAKNGAITLTPILRDLLVKAPTTPDPAEVAPPTHVQTEAVFKNGSLKVLTTGCRYSGNQLLCDFTLMSEGADAELSLYVTPSKIHTPVGNPAGYPLRQIQLGEQSGRSRITQILRANQSYDMIVFGPSDIPGNNSISQLRIKCFSPQLGSFEITFSGIPVLR
jgi:hypothetical protein